MRQSNNLEISAPRGRSTYLRALTLLSLLSHADSFCSGELPKRQQLLRPSKAEEPCVRRMPAPLLLAKKKKAGSQKKEPSAAANSLPDIPLPLMVPDDIATSGSSYVEPSPPLLFGAAELQSGWQEVLSDDGDIFYYNAATGASQWERPVPAPPFPNAAALSVSARAPTTVLAAAQEDEEELPRFDGGLLPFGDGRPALSLPSFDDYKRGPAKPLPADDGSFRSKLTPINPGKPLFDAAEKVEKPFVEKWVTKITWGGIFVLVAIEIFINTPLFQQVRPVVLQFLGDGGYE